MDYEFQEDIPAGLRDSIISYGSLGPLLTVGDRVVWVLRDGPQFGFVRWVGRLPDVTDEGWTIGVEFVSLNQIPFSSSYSTITSDKQAYILYLS